MGLPWLVWGPTLSSLLCPAALGPAPLPSESRALPPGPWQPFCPLLGVRQWLAAPFSLLPGWSGDPTSPYKGWAPGEGTRLVLAPDHKAPGTADAQWTLGGRQPCRQMSLGWTLKIRKALGLKQGVRVATGRGCDYGGGVPWWVMLTISHSVPRVDTGASHDPGFMTLATEVNLTCPWSRFWFPKTFSLILAGFPGTRAAGAGVWVPTHAVLSGSHPGGCGWGPRRPGTPW